MSADNIFSDAKDDESLKVESYLQENSPDELNEVGVTGLQICASNASLSSAISYLKYGASVSHVDKESRWTALHRSLYGGHTKMSMLLIHCGAQMDNDDLTDVANRDKEGLTPMDLLSIQLSDGLHKSRGNLKSSALWSYGKADFILGIPLPKASTVVQPRRVDNLTDKCIVQMCASKYHSCALTGEGEVYTWGHGRGGRLGHGNEASQPEALLLTSLKLRRVLIKQLASGENHTMALSRDGGVYSWGSDRLGQLGHGSKWSNRTATESEPPLTEKNTPSPSGVCLVHPKRVDALRREFVLEVAAGDAHSMCHTRDGSLFAWGSNKSGQLGLKPTELHILAGDGQGVNIPKKVHVEALSRGRNNVTSARPIPGRIVQIAASHNNSMLVCLCHAAALSTAKTATEVYQWGHGIFSPTKVLFKDRGVKPLPLGTEHTRSSMFKPVGHASHVNIIQVAPGQHHFAGVTSDGCVYSWHVDVAATVASIGPERLGERVDERVEGRGKLSLPRPVEGMLSENGGGYVMSIAAASNRFYAVTRVGDLFRWSIPGAMYDGDTTPHRVATVKRAVAVSASADHTLVLCGYTLPPLPLADTEMFAHLCRETGTLLPVVRSAPSHLPAEEEQADGDEDEENHISEAENLVLIMPAAQEVVQDAASEDSDSDQNEQDSLPTLQALCQRVLAKSVNLKTVISALMFAEQFDARLLTEYCTNYISLNFDAVLTHTKPADIDKYVESWGHGDLKRKGRSGSELGLSLRVSDVAPRHVAAAGSGKCNSARTSTKFKKEVVANTAEEVRKQMRAGKKKLGAIAALEEKLAKESGFALSAEQQDKMSRKQELFAEYAHLEQLLVRCEARERTVPAGIKDSATPQFVPPTPPTLKLVPTSVALQAPVTPTLVVTPACAVTHTTSTATPKPTKRSKGISLQEFNSIWNSSTMENPPPTLHTQAKKSPWGAKPVAVTPVESHSSSPLTRKPVVESTPTKQSARILGAVSPSVDNVVDAPKRTRALVDFIPSAIKPAAPATPPAKAGWANSPSENASLAATSLPKAMRFSDIQRTEETARKVSSLTTLQGNSSPWYVERRQRADSMEEVVRQQAWDRAEEEEIARAVAEIDRIPLLTEKDAVSRTSKKKSGGGNRSTKKTPSK